MFKYALLANLNFKILDMMIYNSYIELTNSTYGFYYLTNSIIVFNFFIAFILYTIKTKNTKVSYNIVIGYFVCVSFFEFI